jgi:hypothetical protein
MFDWSQYLGPGASIGAGVGSLVGTKNPANDAQKYLGQIPGTMQPYYQPYIDKGRGALDTLYGQYGNLINDPSELLKKIGSQFQESPGYQYEMDEAMKSAANAAASGGFLGSPQHQLEAQRNAAGIASKGYNDYLQNALGLYGTGLQGLGGINEMGFRASTGLADNLAQTLMSQGNLAYSGRANRNQMLGGGIGNIIGGLAGLL